MRILFRSVLLILLTTSLLSSAICQSNLNRTLRPPVDSLASIIAQADYDGPTIGMMGHGASPSDQFARAQRLDKIASTDELLRLTHYVSPVVRCYALDLLANRKPEGFLTLVNQSFSDTGTIRVAFFDMISSQTVAEHLRKDVLANYFYTLSPTIGDTAIIRQLVRTHESPSAIVALARMKDSTDIPLIQATLADKQNLAFALAAVHEFPGFTFLSQILRIQAAQLDAPIPFLQVCAPLYQALCQYKSVQTLEALKQALALKDQFSASIHRIAIYLALRKDPDTYFDSIRRSISLNDEERQAVEEMMNERF